MRDDIPRSPDQTLPSPRERRTGSTRFDARDFAREVDAALGGPRVRRPGEVFQDIVRQAEAALGSMRPRLAIELLSRAVAAAPAIHELRYNLGTAQQIAGLSAAAAASFKTALILEPGSRTAMGGLSAALEELGEWQEAARMRANAGLTLPVLHRLPKAAPGVVALTIDDGPSPESTPALLRLLEQAQMKASFFLSGQRARRHPELVDAIARAGHDVLGHGYTHRRLDEPGCDPIKELAATEMVLSQHRPTRAPYMVRLPFGSGWLSPELHERIKSWNRETVLVQWTRYFFEWQFSVGCGNEIQLRRACREAVGEGLRIIPPAGTIFLIHDSAIGSTPPLAALTSVTLLGEFLEGLAAKSLRTDSLSGIMTSRH